MFEKTMQEMNITNSETFQLSEGTIILTEDKILINGDKARRRYFQKFVGVGLFGLYLISNTIVQYLHYIKKDDFENHYFFFYLIISFIFLIAALYGLLRLTYTNDIDLASIKKVKSTISSATGYPLLRIFLKDNKVRSLQFGSTDDQRLKETLRMRGLQVN